MERLVANISGKTRRESLNGRDHIVAPLSLIVPGVLAGNRGPIFYSQSELGKNPTAWNHVPIVVYHPFANGRPVSARDPDVLRNQSIGVVLRTKSNGKLTAEGWFDVERMQAVDNRVLEALESGQVMELSTGLELDAVPEDGTFNGKPYEAVARNFRPDHLAILPDQVGACSVDDGCGMMVNKLRAEVERLENQREEMMDWLILSARYSITNQEREDRHEAQTEQEESDRAEASVCLSEL